jgi:S-adenosylmethionine:tRNA ribosyltransferase-isomerase
VKFCADSNDLRDELTAYNFTLPSRLIAQKPAARRENSRLLLVRRNPKSGEPRFENLKVKDIPKLCESESAIKNALWVRNVSKVIPARFYVRRPSGSRHEVVVLSEVQPGVWSALIRNQARFSYPQKLFVDDTKKIELLSPSPGMVDFSAALGNEFSSVEELLERIGEMPLPPYITKRVASRDVKRYQSVWAADNQNKSVAAPTASLHFSNAIVEGIKKRGGTFTDVVLHVGLGTFEPVRSALLSEHKMHAERLEIPARTRELLETHSGPVVAVGTTALRNIESLKHPECTQLIDEKGSLKGTTELFVKKGFTFNYTDSLLTNFHLPESTLLVLVCAFCNSRTLALEAYNYAIRKKYRFFSYGDATLWV